MITDDPNHPGINQARADGQNAAYLVLSEAERARGFVRPVRQSYVHVGVRPKYPTRPLTDDEKIRHEKWNYIAYEEYPPTEAPLVGRYWTQAELDMQCGATTRMVLALAETYARDPKFYGATFCCACGGHFPVGQFAWADDGTTVGS